MNGGFDYGAGGAGGAGSAGASYGGFGGADPMGAFGAGGEGGFVQGGGSQGPSPGSKGKSKDRQTLLPLTVKQLKGATQDHPDDAWKVDGAELHQVKIVGNVLKVEEQSTFTKFDIEDSTGVVEVKLWLDNGDDDFMAERRASCREGTYVRVIGSVRTFQDSLHIVSHDTRPVADPNEVTHHFLECIYQHCQRTKAPPAAPPNGSWGGPPPQAGGGVSAAMAQEGGNGFTPAQSRVLAFFNQNDSNDDEGTGLALDFVASSLRAEGIAEQDVRAAVDFLANEGHLYSTIDDNHYKSTA